jgi:two-component system, cell cycle sensor histidine kinase and response regulator CckA
MRTLRRSSEAGSASGASLRRRLEALLSVLPAAAVWVDGNGKVTDWSAAAERLTGRRGDEALGAPLALVADDPSGSLNALVEAALGGERGETETAIRRAGDQLAPVRVTAAPEHDGSGITGAVVVFTDLSEEHRANGRVEYQAQLLASVGEAILAVDEQLVITAWNRAAEEIYGWSAEEAIGRPVHDVLATELPDHDYAGAVRGLFESGSFTGEVVQRAKDGRALRVEVRATALRLDGGGPGGFVIVNRDVTASRQAEAERARLESELRQSQKLEALGQLAAGVAHDFNNLLTAIHGFGEILVARLADEGLRRDADEVVQAAERGAALTRQLLAFGRRDATTPAALDLSELVLGLEALLRRTLGEQVDLTLDLGGGLPAVLADRGQLEQVLLNLALNARDAMPGGGRLRIATDCVRCDHQATLMHELDAERCVRLVVSDTGVGMSPDVQARAFEPFFTTKDRGRGTGLGLATVWSIVSRTGGALSLDSGEGQGTTVTVLMPAADAVVAGAAQEDDPSAVDGGIETVLVVEDEEAVRRLACRILSDHGYRVLSAADGPEALDVAALHPGPVDLLLTDVVLPSMNGVELAARIAAVRPGIRSLAISGYVAREVLEEGLPEGLAMLPKPFKRDALLTRVREVLGS